MDRHFLEFMGKWLLEVAKGQKQIEDMARWMGGVHDGNADFSRMVRSFCGIDAPPNAAADAARGMEKAMEDLRKSYHEWLDLMGVVPKSEFKSLEKKCRALEEKVAAQQQTIRQLQKLLSEKGQPYTDALNDFSEMMVKQGQQFQELMESMGMAFKTD